MSNDSSKQPGSHAELIESAPKPKPWGPWGATGAGILLFVASQIGASIPFTIYPLSHHWSAEQTKAWLEGPYIQFAYIGLASALTLLGVWWLLNMRGQTFRSIGWGKRFRPMYLVYALAGFTLYFFAYGVARAIAAKFVPELDVNQPQDIGFHNVLGFWPLAATFVSLVVLPPLVEETLFRGFLFTAFRSKYKFWFSTICVSVLFALPHLLGSEEGAGLLWIGALDTFMLSLVLCYVREKTGNLWTSVLIHATKNGLAFLVVFVLHVV